MRNIPSFVAALLLVCHPLARGGISAVQDPISPEQETAPQYHVRFAVDQTFQSNFKPGHGYDARFTDNNCTNTWRNAFEATRRVPLNGGWYCQYGIAATSYDFGDNRSDAPNKLQFYAAQLGLEYWRNGEQTFAIRTSPGLYFSHKLDGRDFDAPTLIQTFYPTQAEGVFLVGGARLSMQSHYPVLPLAGVLWHISPAWDLQAYLPAPRLVYHCSPACKLWLGGEITGGSFRYDDRGKVDYYEVRTGAGVSYQLNRICSLDFDAGAAWVRHFKLSGTTQETEMAPYMKLALNTAF